MPNIDDSKIREICQDELVKFFEGHHLDKAMKDELVKLMSETTLRLRAFFKDEMKKLEERLKEEFMDELKKL